MKILMIDDEKLPIQFTKDASESIKFDDNEVTVMRNYGDGLEALQADRWDILLLDWNLKEYTPERNGMKILRQLHVRKQYANKVGKIIIITSDEKYRLEMLEVCKAMLLDGKLMPMNPSRLVVEFYKLRFRWVKEEFKIISIF